MPIYEFYCPDCHMIYSFFSARIDTATVPGCPRCPRRRLERQMSMFAIAGKSDDNADGDEMPIDEGRMERALDMLAGEAAHINEEDPRQAARLMRKLTDMTGMQLGQGMNEALQRMERGEDPEAVEADMGQVLENEEPFVMKEKKGGREMVARLPAPGRDETLYDLTPPE